MSKRIRQQIEKALLYIERNLEEKITIIQVADHACISGFHFQRLFSAYLGESVSQYILHRRLELAAEKIVRDKHKSLSYIATSSGFETHSSFSRAFKKQFNISPFEFRNNPNLGKMGSDKSRPYLNTTPSKKNSLEVVIKEQATLWFNHKSTHVPAEDLIDDYDENITRVALDFNGFLDEGRPHLFGVASCRIDGYSSRAKSLSDLLSSMWHGGIYTKKNDDRWSDNWFEIDAGLWAVCTHKGHFEFTYQTWNSLICTWLPESGYELRNTIAFERYLSSPLVVQNCEHWFTEIYLPIKKQQDLNN